MKRNLRKDKPKKPKFKEKQDKPSTTIDSVFDILLPAIVDRQLVSTEQSTKLVFKRADGVDSIYTFAYVMKAEVNGDVTLYDETLQQRFIFNLNTDVRMAERLKVYDKNPKRKDLETPEPTPEATVAPPLEPPVDVPVNTLGDTNEYN